MEKNQLLKIQIKREQLKQLLQEQNKVESELGLVLEDLKSRYQEICTSLGLPESFQKELEQEIYALQTAEQRDYVVSRGEFLNAKIMAKFLNYEFVDAKELIFFDPNGNLDSSKTYHAIENRLKSQKNVVVPGFYGEDINGDIKTFERGGSDITGSIVASGVDAALYENWTDVSGLMTADPRVDPNAQWIPEISYEELLTITQNGAQVYHPDAIEPAKVKHIPIQIKNTNIPGDQGTMVTDYKKPTVINIALLGFGTVGQGVEAILRENSSIIEQRLKQSTDQEAVIQIKKILVKNLEKKRIVDSSLITSDFSEIENDPSIQIVVEVIGGDEAAKDYIKRSIQKGKHVVTANKLAIAKSKGALEQWAKDNHVAFLFEAAVAGTIPVIRVIQESLEANHIKEIKGIVNGTTNYILSAMANENKSYQEALKIAQEKGFAEMDPTSDVEGQDPAYKMAILSKLAFGKYPKDENINAVGITQVSTEDIENAKKRGHVIKLIGRAYLKDGEPVVVVEPTEISEDMALAHVNGAGNAVSIYCDNAGEIVLQGQGAGSRPTASAVVSDIINLSKQLIQNKN